MSEETKNTAQEEETTDTPVTEETVENEPEVVENGEAETEEIPVEDGDEEASQDDKKDSKSKTSFFGKKKKEKEQDKPADNVSEEKPENKKDEKKDGDNAALTTAVAVISGILGVGLAIALFAILPTLIFTGIQTLFGDTDISAFRSLTEGIIKIALFVGYLWLTSLMKTMKRLYQYHGAEHKTIFCYEHGEELTVENVRKYKRFHPRCGTSFIFLTLAISILVYTLLPINSEMFIEAFGVSKLIGDMLRVCCKIIFLPIVVGISYELIRIAGKYDNVLTKIISAPGLAIQRLTTKEPADEMIEVAIASMKPVLPENAEDAKW